MSAAPRSESDDTERLYAPTGPRVLIIDDRKTSREIVRVALGARDYEVVEARTGAEGLEQVKRQHFDVILLDIVMPDVNGLEVLQRIRETYSEAERPVIMLSIVDSSRDVVEALQMGANDYVAKPIDIPQLVARVETQIRRKAAEDALRGGSDGPSSSTAALEAEVERLNEELQTSLRTERQIREAAARYRTLFEQAPLISYVVDRGGRIITSSHKGAERLGYTSDALRGVEIADVLAGDSAEVMSNFEACWRKFGHLRTWDTSLRDAKGATFEVRAVCRVVGQPTDARLLLLCEEIDASDAGGWYVETGPA